MDEAVSIKNETEHRIAQQNDNSSISHQFKSKSLNKNKVSFSAVTVWLNGDLNGSYRSARISKVHFIAASG